MLGFMSLACLDASLTSCLAAFLMYILYACLRRVSHHANSPGVCSYPSLSASLSPPRSMPAVFFLSCLAWSGPAWPVLCLQEESSDSAVVLALLKACLAVSVEMMCASELALKGVFDLLLMPKILGGHNSARAPVVDVALELAWNILELDAQTQQQQPPQDRGAAAATAAAALGSEQALDALSLLLFETLTAGGGHRAQDKETRNNLLVLLARLAKLPKNKPFFARTPCLDLLLRYATYAELGPAAAGALGTDTASATAASSSSASSSSSRRRRQQREGSEGSGSLASASSSSGGAASSSSSTSASASSSSSSASSSSSKHALHFPAPVPPLAGGAHSHAHAHASQQAQCEMQMLLWSILADLAEDYLCRCRIAEARFLEALLLYVDARPFAAHPRPGPDTDAFTLLSGTAPHARAEANDFFVGLHACVFVHCASAFPRA